jgi:Chain length determinant protein
MNHFDKTPRRPAAETSFGSGLELWGEAGVARPSRAPDFPEILLFLRRHAVWIVATTILVTLVCAIVVKLAFNQYSATATILFDPRNAKVTGAEQVLSDIGPDSIAIESLVQVAKSDGRARQIEGSADDRPPRRHLCRRRDGQIKRRAKERPHRQRGGGDDRRQ